MIGHCDLEIGHSYQPAASAAERLLLFLGNLAKMKPNLAIVAEFE